MFAEGRREEGREGERVNNMSMNLISDLYLSLQPTKESTI